MTQQFQPLDLSDPNAFGAYYQKNRNFFSSRGIDNENAFREIMEETFPPATTRFVKKISFTPGFSYNYVLNTINGYVAHAEEDCDQFQVYGAKHPMGSSFVFSFHAPKKMIHGAKSQLLASITKHLAESKIKMWPSTQTYEDANAYAYNGDDCVISLHEIETLGGINDESTGFLLF